MLDKADVDRKLFFVLLIASILAAIAALPYVWTLFLSSTERPPIPLSFLIFAQIIQTAIVFSIMIFIGLYLGKKVGFGAPVLESWIRTKSINIKLRSVVWIPVILGVFVGVSLFVLDRVVFAVFIEPVTLSQAEPPLWQRILVSFYGGIGEEIAMRLFLMTLFVWISYKVRRTPAGRPTSLGIWISIILVSVLFGLGHLPMTARFQEITPLVVFRAVLLNGIAGIVFGWLYWKKGLESAMVSHFSTDIVLHVLFPLFV